MIWLMKILKHVPKRIIVNKVIRDKALDIAKIPEYDEYQCGLASMVYKFVDKKGSGGSVKSEFMLNQ